MRYLTRRAHVSQRDLHDECDWWLETDHPYADHQQFN